MCTKQFATSSGECYVFSMEAPDKHWFLRHKHFPRGLPDNSSGRHRSQCGRSGVRFWGWSIRAQCSQRLATAVLSRC